MLKAVNLGRHVIDTGQHHDRQVWLGLAKPGEHVTAVHVRHQQVEDDQAEPPRACLAQAVAAGTGKIRPVPSRDKRPPDERPDFRLVIDYEDTADRMGHPGRWRLHRTPFATI